MANYIMRSNGTTYEEGKKKKKKTNTSNNTSTGNNYIMRDDGTTYLNQSTVSSQTTQLAPVKQTMVADKYSNYSKKQLMDRKNKIQSKMNMVTGGDKNADGKISFGEMFSAMINSSSNKKSTNSKEYKKLKKEYNQVNNALNQKTVDNAKTTTIDKLAEPLEYGVEKANEGINTTIQKLRNIAPSFMKTDKQKITAKAPSLGDLYDQKVQENTKSKLGKVYHDLLFTAGNMMPAMMAPTAGLSLLGTGVTSFGNSYQGAINEGKTDEQATRYGLANATLEVGLQKVLGGISSVYGESLLGKTLKPKVSKVLSNVVKSPTVRNIIAEAGSEFTEEYLQEILDPVVRNITLDENNKFKPFTEEALYNGILGALNSGMINSVSNAGTKHQINKIDKQISELSNQFEKSNGEQQKTILDKINELQSQKQVLSEQVYGKENIKESNLIPNDINNSILDNEEQTKKQLAPIGMNNLSNFDIKKNNDISISDENMSTFRKLFKNAFDKLGKLKSFKQQVNDYENNKISSGEQLLVLPNAKTLEFSNIKDVPIIESQKNLEKGLTGKHSKEVPRNVIENLPEELNNSVLAMDSRTHDNAKVYILNSTNDNNVPIIATIHQGRNIAEIEVNALTSVYEKNDIQSFINHTDSDGKKIYTNKKTNEWLIREGLQLPERYTDSLAFSTDNISQNDKNVNDTSSVNSMQQNEKNNLPEVKENNTIAEEKTNNEEVLTIKPDRKQYSINKRVRKAIKNSSYKGIKEATSAADEYIKFNSQERKTFKEGISKYAGMTKEEFTNVNNYREIETIIKKFANREYNYVDTELKSMKNHVREIKIKVSDDLKNKITDYNDFRKSNFGKLKLGNEGQSINEVWSELSETHPEYFSDNIINEEDMLYALSDFMNEDINLTDQFRLSNEDIETVRDKVFNTLSNNQLKESDITSLQTEIDKVVERRKRAVVQENLLHEMGITREDIQQGNDISAPAYQRTDPVRLHEKVFGYETGKKINDATVYRVRHNEAERTRFLNKERDEIKALGIKPRSKESAAVQKYAEKEYINEKGEYSKYGDRELAKEFTSVIKQNKIKKAAAVLRAKYDTYIDSINEVLIDMGYDPIPKRDNYMKHFYELTDKFSQWGLPFNKESMKAEDLPTDINGITDEFKPGKNWFASAMERKGMRTVYDAITGIDTYIDGASNLIYHTEDIQRYRTLSKFIREEYGQQHGLDNIETMSEEEIEERLSDIQDHKLSKYVAWLDEQANSLAGKKGKIDRAAERMLGRKIYTALNTLKQQVGSNMTGFNVRSAMTNFASAIQGASKTNKLGFIQGTISTVKNIIHKDNLIDKSDFLTNRFGSDNISKKLWQKAINAGQIFMTGTDYFAANQIWRGKYYENLNKGMSETEAIKNADDFASRIMGDRSKGQTAELFNSKTLGLLTQFQLEVNNQWSSLIHDNKMDIQSGNKSGAMVVFQLGQLFGLSYLFNSFMKSVTGSKVMIDPIDLLKKIFGADDDDEEKTLEQRAEEALGSLVDDIPFASVFTGGRIPIGEAFKGAETLAKKWTNQTDKYGNKITYEDVGKDVMESAFYLLLPTGYGQIRKSVKGTSMYSKKHPVAGSYTDSGNLRFEADDSAWGKTKAFLFGQYASKSAQDYINRGYSSVNKDKLKEMKKMGLSADKYTKLKTEITKATKTQDDNKNYKYYDENGKLYYYNKDKDIVYDSKHKKTSIDISELDKAKRKELLEKFLKSKKGLTSEQKNYLLENTFKGGKR